MGKILKLNKDEMRTRFAVETSKKIRNKGCDNEQIEERVFITIQQTLNEVTRSKISSISLYLLSLRGRNKPITLKRKAHTVVKFLNYIFFERQYMFKIKTLSKLDIECAYAYLEYYSRTVSKKTYNRTCRDLTNFYFDLASQGIFKNIKIDEFRLIEIYDKKTESYRKIPESPFDGIPLDNTTEDDKSPILHNIEMQYIPVLLNTALQYTPTIALGIYIQCFGGLRLGEVTNLTRASITPKGGNCLLGMIVNIKHRKLRKDLIHNITSGGSPKKTRRQAIYPYFDTLLSKIYREHIKYLNKIENKNSENALFLNKRGFPMTGENYRYYFNKLKYKFIKILREAGINSGDDYTVEYANQLEFKFKWSTHIGRGIFSNMIGEVADNVLQIAQARGDKRLDSSLTYLQDTTRMEYKLYKSETSMWKQLLNDVKYYKQISN
ncbi:MAG: hypothetical protein ABF633_14905 [Clostridium sp.]|uniref:hypothetical protein n=1 Tax=Clostridium sp. TaxID=1506 RepID=UPI0039EB12C9